jgi:hypothetical protein
MANQITHIVLAEKISDQLFGKFDQKDFLIGTVFPDIRYLKVIDRENTHFKDLIWQDLIDESDSFIAGMKYHSLVDEVREKYVLEKGIYDLIPESRFITQALKIYEDEILYANVSNWDKVSLYFDSILPEELKLVVDESGIKKWHSIIQEYFKQTPSDLSRENFVIGVGFSKEISIEINNLLDQMRKNPEIQETILQMYQDWRLLIGVRD